MKALLSFITAMVIGFGLAFTYLNFHHKKTNPGVVEILQSTMDSLVKIANLPPEIHYQDTFIYRDTVITKYVTLQKPADSLKITTFRDSIINDSVNVWVSFSGNELYNYSLRVRPIYHQVTKTITERVPVIVREPVNPPPHFFWLAGIGSAVTGEILYSRKDAYYGMGVGFMNKPFFTIKYGHRF